MQPGNNRRPTVNPIRLEIFKHLLAAVAEEMGEVLRRTAYSPNIKERRDFSCALFDAQGRMVAQAAHIPVHLGSMPASVVAVVQHLALGPGDVAVVNDPYHGGTHLPDITLVTPAFVEGAAKPFGFVASRAHHADVGGMAPGSMPLAQELFQEGIVLPPLKLVEGGALNRGLLDLFLANVRTPEEREGDLRAQLAANKKGVERVTALASRYGEAELQWIMRALLDYAESMTRRLIAALPEGVYRFHDFMDDDGVDPEPARIEVAVTLDGGRAMVDFSGTSAQRSGGINAVYAITASATYYAFRALIGLDVPSNSGCMAPIEVIAPEGTLVNARPPAAVAGGNVETSQRIVDVLLGALAQAAPERIPAASQGTMNNIAIGGWDAASGRGFAYYETIGGGVGGHEGQAGSSAIHSHMTNTMNTPVEALEFAYPLRVVRYAIREGSGGAGRYPGGEGVRRDVQLLTDAHVTLLTERRRFQPYGLRGGEPGASGENWRLRGEEASELPGKASFYVRAGETISIRTPGGGGHGPPDRESEAQGGSLRPERREDG